MLSGIKNSSFLRGLVLVLLCTVAALSESSNLRSVMNSDVWLHLRTGLSILQSHALPKDGLFSQYQFLVWTDSNWGFDVLFALAYKVAGLCAVPGCAIVLKASFAFAVFWLAGGTQRSFWAAVALSVIAQCLFSVEALPISCSALLFALELGFIFEGRRTGSYDALLWLPALFVLWPTMHITFIYGLLVLVLLLICSAAEEHSAMGTGRAGVCPLPISKIALITFGCAIAPMVSPYGYHAYEQVAKSTTKGMFVYAADLHAVNFRHPEALGLLALSLVACLSLGRRNVRDIFGIALLVGALTVSFAVQRDAWLALLISIAVIGNAFSSNEPVSMRSGKPSKSRAREVTAVVVAAVLIGALIRIPNDKLIVDRIASKFPVRACDFVQENKLPGPLFNEYQWGSFLTWYLPSYPVSIDSRLDLYGDDLNFAYLAVSNGRIDPSSDPNFARAQTILLRNHSRMADVVSGMPQFTVVYSDETAIVLVRKS